MHDINKTCRIGIHFDLFDKGKDQAVKTINSPGIKFPDLYVNLSKIESENIFNRLNDTIKNTIVLVQHILKEEKTKKQKNLIEHSIYKWIFDTGFSFCLDDVYNEILDITVSTLINLYKDVSILPSLAKMIFIRKSKKANIHDIVWAYFRTESINSLKILSTKILSGNKDEVTFTLSLLNIKGESNKDTYDKYVKWVDENEPFIYFTGESFQYSSKPVIYKVDNDYKYICKKHNSVLSIDEQKLLEEFKKLSDENRDLLASYSYNLFKIDKESWNSFLKLPVDKQLSDCNKKGVIL